MNIHTYNILTLPDTISEVIRYLPLEDLDRLCWINKTWYKEIQHELRKRWKIQVFEFYKLELEQKEKKREVRERYPDNEEFQEYMDQEYMDQGIFRMYYKKLFETAKKQVEIERYMLINGMLYGQEKEIVKYNIQEITNEEIPWGQILDSLDYCYIDDDANILLLEWDY
jgi:hypothetical protein